MACTTNQGCVEQKNNLSSEIESNNQAINDLTVALNIYTDTIEPQITNCKSTMQCVTESVSMAIPNSGFDFSNLTDYSNSVNNLSNEISTTISNINSLINELQTTNADLSAQISALGDCQVCTEDYDYDRRK